MNEENLDVGVEGGVGGVLSIFHLLLTAGSHYCCTAQNSLNGDQLTAQFEVDL